MKRGWRFAMWGGLFVAAFLLTALVVMELWNWLIPGIFAGPAISFIQALGLLVLCRLLFKGIMWGGYRNGRGRWGGHWREHWKQKMESLTPEEREKFKQRMKEKCGWTYPAEPLKSTDQPS